MSENSATSANENNDTTIVGISNDSGGGDGHGQSQSSNGGGRPSSYFMEGYTPLNIDMNALVMMNDDDDSEDGIAHINSGGNNDNPDEEMNGDHFAAGYYHMMGAPPRRLNGVKDRLVRFSSPRDDDEEDDDDASNRGNVSDNGGTTDRSSRDGGNSEDSSPPTPAEDSVGVVPDDFHFLAEQALRGLDVEHSSTLERSMDVVGANGVVIPDAEGGDESRTNHLTEFEACFPSFDEKHVGEPNMQAFDEQQQSNDLSVSATSKEGTATKKIDMVAMPKMQINGRPKTTNSKPMDVNAIQKAMLSIRLKSPQLATELDEGASSSFLSNEAHIATDAALASVLNSTSQSIRQAQHSQLVSHVIVPAGPLAAFRRTTPKAQAASANLTRSGTMSEAVLRLWPLICFRRRMRAMGLGVLPVQDKNHHSKTLTIHILGADGVECSSEESVRKSVGPFVRWMDSALQSGSLGRAQNSLGRMPAYPPSTSIDSLLIEFSGPNMPSTLIGKELDLLTQTKSQSAAGLVSAKVVFQLREYHEAPSGTDEGVGAPPADIAIAFNAGIWGYDSWKPTIADMCQSPQSALPGSVDVKSNGETASYNTGIGRTLFVITAYTVEECEDDAEVVLEVTEKVAAEGSLSNGNNLGTVARQLWAPEANPFSSRLERKTASAPPGRKYYENGAWQAWLLGP